MSASFPNCKTVDLPAFHVVGLAFNERMACCMAWYDGRFHPQNQGVVTIDYYEPVM